MKFKIILRGFFDFVICNMQMVKCLCKLVFFSVFDNMNVVISNMIMWLLSDEVVLVWLIILNNGKVVNGIIEVVGMGNVLVI